MWPIYAAGYGGWELFPFARAGATCSNNLTPVPFPSIFESQLPLYFAEKDNGTLRLKPEETIYTLWIGTNDVGATALLTGSQVAGVTLVDTVSCAVNWVKTLYKSGARNFVFQNVCYFLISLPFGAHIIVDGPSPTRAFVFSQFIPQSLLDRATKYYRVERLHD